MQGTTAKVSDDKLKYMSDYSQTTNTFNLYSNTNENLIYTSNCSKIKTPKYANLIYSYTSTEYECFAPSSVRNVQGEGEIGKVEE